MAADPLIGRALGKCRIESRIGAGGMGVVYLAQHEVIEDRRAVKVLSLALANQEGYRERFLKEARLPASLNHPSILPVYDAGDEDGVLYLVMPYIRGADLQAILDDGGPLDIDEAVSILGPVADALDEAHAANLIHRDVKPSNVLVGELGSKGRHVYLSDFGLVKAADEVARASGTTQGMVVGTPPYIPPELWKEEPFDGSLDQYALACTLFHALAGRPPFEATTMYAWMYAHTEGPIPSASALRPQLPKEVDAPLARGLAKDPGDRFESCTALIEAVGSAVGALPAAPADSLETRLREETRIGIETVARQRSGGGVPTTTKENGGRWRRFALIAAAVVLVLGLAFLLIPKSDEGGGGGGGGAVTLEPDRRLPAPPITAARGDGDETALVAVEAEGGGATILRIQKETLRRTPVAAIDDRPLQIVVDGETTWILTSDPGGVGTLVRVQGDGSEPDLVNVGGAPGEMTQTAGEIWVTVPSRDEILVVDKGDLARDVIRDVKGPSLITPAGGLVIVVGEQGGSSIDASSHVVVDGPEPIEGVPTDIATAGGDVWLATEEGPVFRIDIVDGVADHGVEALDAGGELLRVAPASAPVAVWFPLKDEGSLVVARNLSISLEEQRIPLPDPAILISSAGDPVVAVTAPGDVLRIDANSGDVAGGTEHVEGNLGPMVPLGNDVLLLASDGSMYLLSRES